MCSTLPGPIDIQHQSSPPPLSPCSSATAGKSLGDAARITTTTGLQGASAFRLPSVFASSNFPLGGMVSVQKRTTCYPHPVSRPERARLSSHSRGHLSSFAAVCLPVCLSYIPFSASLAQAAGASVPGEGSKEGRALVCESPLSSARSAMQSVLKVSGRMNVPAFGGPFNAVG